MCGIKKRPKRFDRQKSSERQRTKDIPPSNWLTGRGNICKAAISGALRWGPDMKAEARAEAESVVGRWNRRLANGRDMLWSSTIRAALLAGTPWLDVF
jgi:hypothetical protein